MFIFVLLYHIGSENEGIHALNYSGKSCILMFESGVGANYYASLLEAYGFPKPTAKLMDEKEIKAFCLDSGYTFQFIPTDHVVIPPKKHTKSEFLSKVQNAPPLELSRSNLNSEQKEYYLITLRKTYFIYRRNIVDLERERATRGFSVEMNRQIEYYTEEVQKIELEIQRWV